MATKANPNVHLLAASPYQNHSFYISKPRVDIRVPLHRPEYGPLEIKLRRKKLQANRPISRVSDVLRLISSLKLSLPEDIYNLLIKECSEMGDPIQAIELHRHIKRSGLRLRVSLANRLLLMYVSIGCLELALQLFDTMPIRDANSWAVAIAGHVESGQHTEALQLFNEMMIGGVWKLVCCDLSRFSVSGILICVLKACLRTKNLELGKQLHALSFKMGYYRSAALSSFLINFYGKLKCPAAAQNAFSEANTRNTAVWTSRLENCCNDSNLVEVISVFMEMSIAGVVKNAYTFSTVLKACAKTGTAAAALFQQVHSQVVKLGLEFDPYVLCALVDFYGTNGFQKDAVRLFRAGNGVRSAACSNVILTSYIRRGLYFEAVEVIHEMEIAGTSPTESVLKEICFLRACMENCRQQG